MRLVYTKTNLTLKINKCGFYYNITSCFTHFRCCCFCRQVGHRRRRRQFLPRKSQAWFSRAAPPRPASWLSGLHQSHSQPHQLPGLQAHLHANFLPTVVWLTSVLAHAAPGILKSVRIWKPRRLRAGICPAGPAAVLGRTCWSWGFSARVWPWPAPRRRLRQTRRKHAGTWLVIPLVACGRRASSLHTAGAAPSPRT